MASHGVPVIHIWGKSVNFSSGDEDGLPEPGKQKKTAPPGRKIRKERSVECVFGCYWCAVAAYTRPIPVTGVDVSKGQLWLSIPGSSLIDTYYNRKKQLTNHPIPGAHTDLPIPATGLIPADSVDAFIPATGLIVLPLGERYTNPQGTDRSPQARS